MTFKEKTKNLVSEQAFKNLEKYVYLIEEKNLVMNLTGFKGDKLWGEGIYESILLLKESFGIVNNKKILDIGSGAGFPSVPYLIAFPNNELTIYEPQKKRTKFLSIVKDTLNLNMRILNIRAEDSKEEEYFDFITARAVANFSIMAEISHKPAKIGAKFSFIKGPKAEEEIKESLNISRQLNLFPELKKISINGKNNILIIYSKNEKTPERFPRKWTEIIKK
ncbi:MAG: 16S rRNA (guanine(527)-N(7))-methyltransferase RsmG [Mycoplasmatales bacterium]|nr:16S rRNA (guanine(527)-N(7))-methyltransferase RsmG [Mycoplasmatales bacterium]